MLAAAAYGTSLPPHDLDASTGESAYPFDGLCSKHLWDSLHGELFVEAASNANAREKLEMEKVCCTRCICMFQRWAVSYDFICKSLMLMQSGILLLPMEVETGK